MSNSGAIRSTARVCALAILLAREYLNGRMRCSLVGLENLEKTAFSTSFKSLAANYDRQLVVTFLKNRTSEGVAFPEFNSEDPDKLDNFQKKLIHLSKARNESASSIKRKSCPDRKLKYSGGLVQNQQLRSSAGNWHFPPEERTVLLNTDWFSAFVNDLLLLTTFKLGFSSGRAKELSRRNMAENYNAAPRSPMRCM
ncbi:hypothetical protein Tco_0792019 [Tanacetum coccineum]